MKRILDGALEAHAGGVGQFEFTAVNPARVRGNGEQGRMVRNRLEKITFDRAWRSLGWIYS